MLGWIETQGAEGGRSENRVLGGIDVHVNLCEKEMIWENVSSPRHLVLPPASQLWVACRPVSPRHFSMAI